MTKRFYDDDAMKRIEKLSTSGKPAIAFKELTEYMEKYPRDNFSHIVNAEILLQLGKTQEALEEIEHYMNEPMHGHMVECSIATTYGSILLELGRYEEGINQLRKAIAEHKSFHKHETCAALNRLVKFYINRKDADAALALLNRCKATPTVKIKKAQIYIIKSDFYKAIDLLSDVRETDISDNYKLFGLYNYLYGKALYLLRDFDNAESYLKKCVETHCDYASRALNFLGHIECSRLNTNKAIKYGFEILKDKKSSSRAFELLARAYTDNNSFDQAEDAVNKIEDYYWKHFRLARLYFAKKDFVNAEKEFSKVLHCNVEKYFDENINYYVLCKFRQKKYEEALYIIDNVMNQGIKETHDMAMIRVYLDSLNKAKLDLDKLSYSAKQVFLYSKDDAIKHIISHHVIDSRMSSFNDSDIKRIYEEAQSKINVSNAKPDSFFDKHVLYYREVGISVPEDPTEESETINQLEIVTLPETKDILTMYPRKGSDAYLDEKELPEYKQKRLSRIDKFNMKYGLK